MTKTLEEAKDEVRAGIKAGGVRCPCCSQLVKAYKRSLSKAQAEGLRTFRQEAGDGWAHAPSIEGLARLGGDWSRLSHWGLIEEGVGKREDGGRAGQWRITEAGRQFLRGELAVPKNIYTYNGQVFQIKDSGTVKITDLGKFDLRENLDPLDDL